MAQPIPKILAAKKDLIRRYLIWCYKTTKEELDRVDRKSTQLEVDYFVRQELEKDLARAGEGEQRYQAKVKEFDAYIREKEKGLAETKLSGNGEGVLQENYWYLSHRFLAVKKAVGYFLGARELKKISEVYEQEMVRRIWQARDH